MKLFTYGSLMAPDIMEEVSGGRFDSFEAFADGYQRFCVRGEHYPGMVAEANGRVEGVVYENIDSAAIGRLDIFEGEMYSRQRIKVTCLNDGVEVEAMTYTVKADYCNLLTDEIWSYQHFLEKGKRLFTERYIGFQEISRR